MEGDAGDEKRESLLLGNHHFGFARPVAQAPACNFLPLPCLFSYLRELKLALPWPAKRRAKPYRSANFSSRCLTSSRGEADLAHTVSIATPPGDKSARLHEFAP